MTQGMSWVVDKSSRHAMEKPDFETASSDTHWRTNTCLQKNEHNVAFLHCAAFPLLSTSAQGSGRGIKKKKEEEEIIEINGSQPCSVKILYNPHILLQNHEMWLKEEPFGPLHLLAFDLVCILKEKMESKGTSKQHGL